MINPKEIRIGNFVQHIRSERVQDVESISDTGINITCYGGEYDEDSIKDFKYIPITEEWLLKLGWKKYLTNGETTIFEKQYHFVFNGLPFQIWWDKNDNAYKFYGGPVVKVIIKYVHQLQNMYFALTGEELSIQAPSMPSTP